MRCADIRVPLDYSRPRGRGITIAIARSRATDTTRYAGPLLINLGGPANPVLATVPTARAEPTEALDAGLAGQLTGAQSAQLGMRRPITARHLG